MPQSSPPNLSLLSLQLSPLLPLHPSLPSSLLSLPPSLLSLPPSLLSLPPSLLSILLPFQLNKAVLKMSERCKCLEEELTETKVLYRKEFQQRKLLHNEVCVCAYVCTLVLVHS